MRSQGGPHAWVPEIRKDVKNMAKPTKIPIPNSLFPVNTQHKEAISMVSIPNAPSVYQIIFFIMPSPFRMFKLVSILPKTPEKVKG